MCDVLHLLAAVRPVQLAQYKSKEIEQVPTNSKADKIPWRCWSELVDGGYGWCSTKGFC